MYVQDEIIHFKIIDCVVRTVYYKYGYPKECLIQSSMICPVLLEAMMGGEEENLTILFPNGW